MKRFSTAAENILKTVLTAVFWIVIWQILALIVNRELLVQSPLKVFIRLIELMSTPSFWTAALGSLFRIALGFVLGAAAAVWLSILTVSFGLADTLLTPLLTVIKSTPVASFIIITLVWIDTPYVPVFIVFLMVLPVIWGNMTAGIRNVDKNLLEMTKLFKFKPINRLKLLYYPSLKPYIRSGALTAVGLAWKAGITAEVLCTPRYSIGKYLYESKVYLETTDLFAWTVVVVAMSMAIEKLIKVLLYDKTNKNKQHIKVIR